MDLQGSETNKDRLADMLILWNHMDLQGSETC